MKRLWQPNLFGFEPELPYIRAQTQSLVSLGRSEPAGSRGFRAEPSLKILI